MKPTTLILAFAVLLTACGAGPDPSAAPTRTLDTSCPGTAYKPAHGLTLDVTCDGQPVSPGLRCGELAELPADVECSLQPMIEGSALGAPFDIPAGADAVSVRVVVP